MGEILGLPRPHPVRIAVDGPDAAGKTTLADELAERLRARGRHVVRAGVDGFHRPRAERYRRGRDSAVGCYEDTYDLDALRRVLLDPLGPRGDRRYRVEVFDHTTDAPVSAPLLRAPTDAVVLVDGVFLQRPELDGCWDLRIYVAVADDEILRRAGWRDAAALGSIDEVLRRYRRRYLPAQRLYRKRADPLGHADIVVYNDDPAAPVMIMKDRRAHSTDEPS
jgi:uridine kinase